MKAISNSSAAGEMLSALPREVLALGSVAALKLPSTTQR